MGTTFGNVLSRPEVLKTGYDRADWATRLTAYFSAIVLDDMIKTVKKYGLNPELEFDEKLRTNADYKSRNHMFEYLTR